jgi:hypothetical protein
MCGHHKFKLLLSAEPHSERALIVKYKDMANLKPVGRRKDGVPNKAGVPNKVNTARVE